MYWDEKTWQLEIEEPVEKVQHPVKHGRVGLVSKYATSCKRDGCSNWCPIGDMVWWKKGSGIWCDRCIDKRVPPTTISITPEYIAELNTKLGITKEMLDQLRAFLSVKSKILSVKSKMVSKAVRFIDKPIRDAVRAQLVDETRTSLKVELKRYSNLRAIERNCFG